MLPKTSDPGSEMNLTLRQQLSRFSHLLQSALFPVLEEELGEISDTNKRLIAALNLIPLARFIPSSRGWMGRPSKDRVAIASAFVAKAVYNFENNRDLLDRLASDRQLLAICGWKHPRQVPHESTFSRAFAEFAEMQLPQFVHEALIRETQKDRIIGHIARDSTAIAVRETVKETARQRKPKQKSKARARSRNRKPRKARQADDPPTRLERQRTMTLEEMLAELPSHCTSSAKVSSDGHNQYWSGYKLHLDVADGQIPISAVLTSAHLHDSQVAIPLSTMTAQRVTALYELMDGAYDAQEIMDHVRAQGRVPIITPVPRGKKSKSEIAPNNIRQLSPAEEERFRERTMVERAYGRLKDEFGGRSVRVRGAAKVMAHLMFGVLVLTADQLLRFVSDSS
jgi:Transposase DDE domain/Transposase domain (DUF772)